MKLPWQKSPETPATECPEPADGAPATPEQPVRKGYTAPKGHATPKRRDQELARGVRRGSDMAPTTPAEQRRKRKELKNSMSKEEWKAHKRKERESRRAAQQEAQAAMDRGDERYLLPRDQGKVRAFVRDWVDARRFLNQLVMPAALVLLVILLLANTWPQVGSIASLVALIFIVALMVEGVVIGKRANNAVRQEFPNTTETGFGLGFYAYSRASQPRRWRSPKPRTQPGGSAGSRS